MKILLLIILILMIPTATAQIETYSSKSRQHDIEIVNDLQLYSEMGYVPVVQYNNDSIVLIRTTWEYQTRFGFFPQSWAMTNALNAAGDKGWQLVSIVPLYDIKWNVWQAGIEPHTNYMMIWKRPKVDVSPVINEFRKMVASNSWPDSLYVPVETDKININNAPLDLLITLPGIGATIAQRIIDNRPYTTIEELDDRVAGIGTLTLNRLRNLITAQ